ncbi:hypothetical protein G7Z17_g942 [Cylindrodendrum hubeiense]|uniref:Uncharacterized protein n=1 Tax=Cylindrodendrum hubeiense TaxID=595255 RepID=A0A9P5HKD6_9HYPO|nr:hypothetical protein G7Z17_g942 [Cylindrodendrum hubeiense]
MEDRLARMEVLLRASRQPGLTESGSDSIVDSISVASQDQWSRSPGQLPNSVPSDAPDALNSPPRSLQDEELQAILPSPCPEMSLMFSASTAFSPAMEPRPELSESIPTNITDMPLADMAQVQEAIHMPVSPPSTAAPDDCAPNSTTYQGARRIYQFALFLQQSGFRVKLGSQNL